MKRVFALVFVSLACGGRIEDVELDAPVAIDSAPSTAPAIADAPDAASEAAPEAASEASPDAAADVDRVDPAGCPAGYCVPYEDGIEPKCRSGFHWGIYHVCGHGPNACCLPD
jgi:hypothetical protein